MSYLSKLNLRNFAVKSSLMLVLALMLGLMLVACGEDSPTAAPQNTTNASGTTASATTQNVTPFAATAIEALATVTPAFTNNTTATPTVVAAVPTVQTTTATTTANTTQPVMSTTITAPPTTAQNTTASVTTLAQTTTTAPTTANPTTNAVATTVNPSTTVPLITPPVTVDGMGKLAYVESGNLYIYDLSNQSKKLLYQATSATGVVGTPIWSPDNSRLLITLRDDLKKLNSRTNLYLLKLNGGEPQKIMVSGLVATCEESPVWSGDGRYIAFTEVLDSNRSSVFSPTNQREIWLVDSNGQNPRKIADGLEPAWSADSSSVAYVTNGSLKAGNGFRQTNAIHTLKVATANTDREVLTTAKIPADLTPYGIPFGSGTFYLHTPVFLNNDKTLGFVAQGATGLVATVAAAGGDLKIWDAQPEGGFGRTFTDPTNGSHFMFESFPPSGISHIIIIDVSLAPLPVRVNQVNFGGEKFKESANNPSWSPDGSQVAYLYQTEGNNVVGTTGIPGALAIATKQATKPQTLLKGVLTGLAWSH